MWRSAPRYGYSLVRYLFFVMRHCRRAETPVNILGIWDGHDSGAALLVDGRLVAARQRGTFHAPQARSPVSGVDRACLRWPASSRGQVDVVAASTSDLAKTLGRVVSVSQGTVLRASVAGKAARRAVSR